MPSEIEASFHQNITYAEGLQIQKNLLAALRKNNEEREHIIFCEHQPVITLGRSGDGRHLKTEPEKLTSEKLEFHKVGRGGDVTFHGPGQWTVYPILRLDKFCKDLHRYMRMLEECIILYLSGKGIKGSRSEINTGVWVGKNKICAIGISCSSWISWHGFALNIQPDLDLFTRHITPCGISSDNGGVTSLKMETAGEYSMQEEAYEILKCFCKIFPYKCIKANDVKDNNT